jgi:tripartite-type tricarboxylate transporter receptor subunit TctC
VNRISRFIAVALVAAFSGAALAATDYPNKPVKWIVPYPPGGTTDVLARIIATWLTEKMGQTFIIENKAGGGNNIGTELAIKSPPDGYTLLLASQTNAISATLYQKLPFDPIEDFAPITLIGREPGVLVVNPALPVKTLPEFIAYVKARPGQVDYASSGNGSGQHLFMAMLASMTGMQLSHVPYKGSGQATTDLLAGQVMASIPGTAGMVGHIKAGKLRPLAVTGSTRSQQLPEVQTVAEQGVAGYEAYVWMGLLAPKGTPPAIIDKIYRDVKDVLAGNEVKSYMATAGIEIVGSTPAEFGAFYRHERTQWAKIIKETGAKAD